ncbi:MAG: hypothetical protein JWM33_2856 [Caulobacteraceae bacterium]|nr:hypothetical protein [Caulobacteraceae bacterium]
MTPETARDDLAFMRALVSGEARWSRQFGRIYAAAGACYAVQMVGHIGQRLDLAPGSGPVAELIGWGPTVVFVVLLIAILRRRVSMGANANSRAMATVFAAVGLANLVLCLSMGAISLRLHNPSVWLIYPCVVMILQGLAWMAAYMLRRRAWLCVIGIGWFAVGLAMAWFITNMTAFIAAATIGIVCFMLLPGLYLLRQAQEA